MKLKNPKLLVSAAAVSILVVSGVVALNGNNQANSSLKSESSQSLVNPSGIKTANPQQAGVNQITEPTATQGTQNKTSVSATPGCDVATSPNNTEDEDMDADTMDDNETSVSVSCESSSNDGDSGNSVNINSSSSQSVQSSSGNASSSNRTSIDVNIN